jgi:hypothetical protein
VGFERRAISALAAAASIAGAAGVAGGVEEVDVVPGVPFQEGDTIGFEQIDKLRSYLPEPFWEHREYFFFEGMELEIGPFHADYSAPAERRVLTDEYAGTARLGPDGALEDYVLGRPFPEVSPDDPEAGLKHAWNHDYRHDALEGKASWHFTFWDRGEQLPLWYKGTGWAMRLTHRTDRAEDEGRVFPKEKRKGAGGIEVLAPFDARGILGLGYRYLSADGPLAEARRDDVWVYVPWLRRVRRLSASQRTDAIAGTDMTPDDAGGFSGIVPQFQWAYVGEQDVLAPIDSRKRGYPYSEQANFGPTGFSLANDVWELRHAIVLEQEPVEENHPYRRKRMWIDAETYAIHYAAAYDRRGELWKLIQSANRWSESEGQEVKVEGMRTLMRVCDVLVNVQSGTGVRIELYDVQPTRLSKGGIRRQIDIGRLNREGR